MNKFNAYPAHPPPPDSVGGALFFVAGCLCHVTWGFSAPLEQGRVTRPHARLVAP